MAKVTGVGGVFFKSKGDSAALAAWYRKHLGMALEDFGGAILRWPDDKAEDLFTEKFALIVAAALVGAFATAGYRILGGGSVAGRRGAD